MSSAFGEPKGDSLIKVTRVWDPTLRLVLRALQQLKMLPKVDTKSHFDTPKRIRYLILISLKQTNEKL